MSQHESRNKTADESTTNYGHMEVRAGDAGLVPGAIVLDKETEDSDQAVVLDVYRDHAADVYVELTSPSGSELKTVAELNPDYPEDDAVAKIAFLPQLESALSWWQKVDRAILKNAVANETDIRMYDYPTSRLEVTSLE